MTDRIHFFTMQIGSALLIGGMYFLGGISHALITAGVLLIAAVIAARMWGN